MAETQGLRNMIEDLRSYSTGLSTKIDNLSTKTDDVNSELDNIIVEQKKLTGYVKSIFSVNTESDTVSSTRHDTGSDKICKVYFVTNGALKSLTCTNMVNDSDVTSATTHTAGSIIWVKDATKVQTSTHGTQIIYLNA